eukprot:TRINITY_DN10212_c1_g1_i2.p1 TRINITY_DN10212_c1_g1~~TRINITY_DN10212_c1_g1_i2.p1  ORF type:complete len:458 (+),score=70.32 TRINITY_DN10212_c1_g1_i2:474-1847(+)
MLNASASPEEQAERSDDCTSVALNASSRRRASGGRKNDTNSSGDDPLPAENQSKSTRDGNAEKSDAGASEEAAAFIRPDWAREPIAAVGSYALPGQPNCSLLASEGSGRSDHGLRDHACRACGEGCGMLNRQVPVKTSWRFKPPLSVLPALDLYTVLEFPSVDSLAPLPTNGLSHRWHFTIGRPDGPGFAGSMGPQVRGGVGKGEALFGEHGFEIKDTVPPAPDGSLVRGRWLALPGERRSGDIGSCSRKCVGCEDYPQLEGARLATGLVCKIDIAIGSGSSFVYRLRQSSESVPVLHDGDTYYGAQWDVNIHDASSGAFFVLGRVVLEGTSKANGVISFSSRHEPLGCLPCDAAFQAVRTAGPFIMVPKDVHSIKKCDVQLERTGGQGCAMQRVVGLGGLTLLYESGPGVSHDELADSSEGVTLFTCAAAEGSGLNATTTTAAPPAVEVPPGGMQV